MTLVLDASMTITWLFDDQRTPAAERLLLQVAATGATVPSLWRLEVANVLRVAVRRGRCDEAYVDRMIGRLSQLPIRIDDETDDRAWTDTLTLARQYELTLYDAAYLELALRLRQPLATCDTELVAAAGQRNVQVMSA